MLFRSPVGLEEIVFLTRLMYLPSYESIYSVILLKIDSDSRCIKFRAIILRHSSLIFRVENSKKTCTKLMVNFKRLGYYTVKSSSDLHYTMVNHD